MAAKMHVWNGSSWVELNAADNAKTARVWDGSSWVQFHPGVRLNKYDPSTQDIMLGTAAAGFIAPVFATVRITLNSSGAAAYSFETSNQSTTNFTTFNWLLTGANSEYYAYMDAPSGSAFSTGTTGTSLQLNTTREWTLTVTRSVLGVDTASNTSTLRIKTASGVDILALTTNFDVYAEVF
jgi:hypothetical protein